MKLPQSEEQVIQILWKKEKAFMKDIIEAYPDPKPAPTTIATLLKRMQDKGVVDHKKYGNVREYFPVLKKEEYFSNQMTGMIKNFFNDSVGQFASFFTSEKNLTDEQLEELKNIVEEQIKARKK